MTRPISRSSVLSLVPFVAAFATAACSSPASESDRGSDSEQAFSSNQATLLDFEFDGQLVTDSTWSVRDKIQDQFLYTIGHLNANRSVGRLDDLELTNVKTSTNADGQVVVTYHARLPVAWGSKSGLPTSYAFTLPKQVSYSGLEAFTSKYKSSCVDWGAHDVDSGSMWYYYRPKKSGCALDPADVVTFTASVTRSSGNTSGKYPEYHKVWENDSLDVVAIFGKFEDGATSNDAGIDAYDSFLASMKSTLGALSLTTVPASVPNAPGVSTPEVAFHAKMADGKSINVTALLVDNVRTAGPAFDQRYAQLSPTADVIMYNGHAGLGQNVQALAHKGQFLANRYLLLFMNGCDTFAYVDGYLAQTRAALNPSDPEGTKFMDIVTNAMPSYFASDAAASTALVKGLMSVAQPKTFDQMFDDVDDSQVVLVTGEEDNAFTPGMPIGSGGGGTGGGGNEMLVDVSGTVAKSASKPFKTDTLAAGTYVFEMTGDGDADLYVRKGLAPTTTRFDCRPYQNGSAETCTVTLTSPGTIYGMVRGYAATSTFHVTAHKQ